MSDRQLLHYTLTSGDPYKQEVDFKYIWGIFNPMKKLDTIYRYSYYCIKLKIIGLLSHQIFILYAIRSPRD